MDVALEKSPPAEVPKVQSVGYGVNLSGKRTELIMKLQLPGIPIPDTFWFIFRARSRNASVWLFVLPLSRKGNQYVSKSGSRIVPHRM